MSYDDWLNLGQDKEKWPEMLDCFWGVLEGECKCLEKDIRRWLRKRECRHKKEMQKDLTNLLSKVKLMLKKFPSGEYGKPDRDALDAADNECSKLYELFEDITSDEDWFDLGDDREKWPEILHSYWSQLKKNCLLLRKDIRRWLSKEVCKNDKDMQEKLTDFLMQIKLMLKKFHTGEFGKPDSESFLFAQYDYADILESFENATSDDQQVC